MRVKFVHRLIVGTCLWAGGCGPCALTPGGHLDPIPERISSSPLRNGNAVIVGTLDFSSSNPDMLRFSVDQTALKGGAGAQTYTLEVYPSGANCPPDPGSKLRVLGTATYSGQSVMSVDFTYEAPSSLQFLDGKMLVLRAAAQNQDPVASVVCTAPLQYIPASAVCAGD